MPSKLDFHFFLIYIAYQDLESPCSASESYAKLTTVNILAASRIMRGIKTNYMRVISTEMINEPPHDKTNKVACAPSKDSDRPWQSPSLINVFAVRMKKA